MDSKLKAQLEAMAKARGLPAPDDVLASGRKIEIKTVETKPRPKKKPVQGDLGEHWWSDKT